MSVEEKSIQEKSSQEKPSQEKSIQEKSSQEKPSQEKSSQEKSLNVTKQVIILSLDIESTGLSKWKDTTIELGIDIVLAETDGKTLKIVQTLPSFQHYACGRDGIRISDKAAEITGLSRDFLALQTTLDILFENCVKHVDQVCLDFPDVERSLIAYNGNAFDIPILVADAEKCYKAGGARGFFRRLRVEKIIDILHVARKHADMTQLKRNAHGRCSYKLGDLFRSVTGENLDGAHGAIADCKAVTRVIGESKEINTAVASAFEENNMSNISTSLMILVRKALTSFNDFNGNVKKRSILDVLMKHGKKTKHE
jgi:DNA polymerase III epsilon subunit-like protein